MFAARRSDHGAMVVFTSKWLGPLLCFLPLLAVGRARLSGEIMRPSEMENRFEGDRTRMNAQEFHPLYLVKSSRTRVTINAPCSHHKLDANCQNITFFGAFRHNSKITGIRSHTTFDRCIKLYRLLVIVKH